MYFVFLKSKIKKMKFGQCPNPLNYVDFDIQSVSHI